MPEPIYYLLYSSKTMTYLPESQLVLLLEQSRFNNANRHITGMLLYMEALATDECGGRFVQVLEGSEAAIKHLYSLIERDPRHFGLVLLSEGEQNKRHFSEWTMGFANLDRHKKYAAQFDPDVFFLDETFPKDPNHLLKFLQYFYQANLNPGR